jgi:hypothetical protein
MEDESKTREQLIEALKVEHRLEFPKIDDGAVNAVP